MHHWHNSPSERTLWGLDSYETCSQISNISGTLGNTLDEHSDVVGASPVGAAPTTSSFSTSYMASMELVMTTARRYKKHSSFGIWGAL